MSTGLEINKPEGDKFVNPIAEIASSGLYTGKDRIFLDRQIELIEGQGATSLVYFDAIVDSTQVTDPTQFIYNTPEEAMLDGKIRLFLMSGGYDISYLNINGITFFSYSDALLQATLTISNCILTNCVFNCISVNYHQSSNILSNCTFKCCIFINGIQTADTGSDYKILDCRFDTCTFQAAQPFYSLILVNVGAFGSSYYLSFINCRFTYRVLLQNYTFVKFSECTLSGGIQATNVKSGTSVINSDLGILGISTANSIQGTNINISGCNIYYSTDVGATSTIIVITKNNFNSTASAFVTFTETLTSSGAIMFNTALGKTITPAAPGANNVIVQQNNL